MAVANRHTVVIPMDLGPAADYDRAGFPLSRFEGRDSLGKVGYLLDATLEEMTKIQSMAGNSRQIEEFINVTKKQIDELLEKHEGFEQKPRTRNPVKLIARYRAVLTLMDATRALYISTKRKSDNLTRSMKRSLISVNEVDVRPAGYHVPPDANITGIAVQLGGPADEETTRTIAEAADVIATYAEPFADSLDLNHLSTNIAPSEPEPVKGTVTPVPSPGETSGPSCHSQDSSSTSRPTSPPASETSASPCLQESSPTIPKSTSPSTSEISGSRRRSQGTPPSIQNFYYFDRSFVSPKSNVYGPSLVHGGSKNSGAVNHFTTLNGVPEAD